MAVCLPTVVAEFTRLTTRLKLIDCRDFLPGGADAVRCQRPLEMFFPFDPVPATPVCNLPGPAANFCEV